MAQKQNLMSSPSSIEYLNSIKDAENILKSDKKEKSEFLRWCRNGAPNNNDPVTYLTFLANETHDQSIQNAAITGLTKHNHPTAVLGIANRLLNNWGMRTIKHTINQLTKLKDQGGLILLSATFFYDNRFFHEKLEAIKKILGNNNNMQGDMKLSNNFVDFGELFREPKLVNKWMKVFKRFKNNDIKEGAIWGSQYKGLFGYQSHLLEKCSDAELLKATYYIEKRIPGLDELFCKHLAKKRTFLTDTLGTINQE